jgi:acetyl-CoA acetyltransferase
MRLPPAPFDLRIADAEAADLSAALALLFTAGKPWRLCREALLAAYPASRRQRQERFAEVMAGLRDYAAAELEAELPDLVATARALAIGGQALEANGLLELLRSQPFKPNSAQQYSGSQH